MGQRWFWWDFWINRSVPVSSCSTAVPNRSADGHGNVTFSKWWAPPVTSRPCYTRASCRWPRWMHATAIIIAFSPNAQDLVWRSLHFWVCFKDFHAGDPFHPVRHGIVIAIDYRFCPSISLLWTRPCYETRSQVPTPSRPWQLPV